MQMPIIVCGIGANKHNASQYTVLDFFLPAKNGVWAYIKRELHIVDNLEANVLLGMDIVLPEGWQIDLELEKLTLPQYSGIQVPIITKVRTSPKQFLVFSKKSTIVLP
jgi:hypothetical protein